MTVEVVATPEGTPPAGDDPKPTGTPPAGEGGAPPAAPATDGGVGAAESPKPEGKAWDNFKAKYPGMADEAVQELFAERWWETNRYNTELKGRLDKTERERDAALESAKPKPKDEPRKPHPDVEKIANKIKGLVKEDEGLFAEAEAAAQEYSKRIKEAERFRGRGEQAKAKEDNDDAERWDARADAAEAHAAASESNLKNIKRTRNGLARQVDELIAEQQWVDQWSESNEAEQEEERQETEAKLAAFPGWVDEQTVVLAKDMGIEAADKHTLTRIGKSVRRGMTADMARPEYVNRDVNSLPLVDMIRGHIKEWMDDHDFTARRKFGDESEAKLKVSTPEGGKPAATDDGKPKPEERPKGPVPVSYLARGGEAIPEAWRRGREALKKAGLD